VLWQIENGVGSLVKGVGSGVRCKSFSLMTRWFVATWEKPHCCNGMSVEHCGRMVIQQRHGMEYEQVCEPCEHVCVDMERYIRWPDGIFID
jgi:hypothetical protein